MKTVDGRGNVRRTGFASTEKNRPENFEAYGLKAKTFLIDDIMDNMYDYSAIPLSGEQIRIQQICEFPADALDDLVGRNFEVSSRCFAYKLDNPVMGVEFLDANQEVVSSEEKSIPTIHYSFLERQTAIQPPSVSISAKIPPEAVSARVYYAASGDGTLIPSDIGSKHILLAGSLWDQIAHR
ncbi:MAG: hypothetical protein U5N86_13230 [Planctomycetota bacterium]|nr:hypothetical protein [Planctomycetota bacterium]